MHHPSLALTCTALIMDTAANTSRGNPNPNSSEAMQAPASELSHAIRCCRIRRAAHASMAYSAGAGRAWSRALFRKLQLVERLRSPPVPGRRVHEAVVIPRRRIQVVRLHGREQNRAESALRQLVHGGASMDFCDLLEEAVDYIRCLSTLVKLMQTIAASFS